MTATLTETSVRYSCSGPCLDARTPAGHSISAPAICGEGFAYRAWRLHAAPMWLFNQLRRARNDVREHWLREYWKRNHRRDAV
jgi:hypothetical protein